MDHVISSNQSPQRESAENRVAKISSFLRLGTGCLLFLHILGLVLLVAWLVWSPTATSDAGVFKEFDLSGGELKVSSGFWSNELSMHNKVLIFGYCALIALFSAYCVSRIHNLFGNFINKEIFTQRNSKLLRHLGYALILGIIFGKLLYLGVIVTAVALDTSSLLEPDIKLTLSISTNFMLKVLMIGMVFLFAWVLDIGRELYADVKFTI